MFTARFPDFGWGQPQIRRHLVLHGERLQSKYQAIPCRTTLTAVAFPTALRGVLDMPTRIAHQWAGACQTPQAGPTGRRGGT